MGGFGIAVSSGPGSHTELFDDLERFLSLESPDDPPERAGKPTNIVVEGEIFLSWGSRGGHGENVSHYAVRLQRVTAKYDYRLGAMGGTARGFARNRPRLPPETDRQSELRSKSEKRTFASSRRLAVPPNALRR